MNFFPNNFNQFNQQNGNCVRIGNFPNLGQGYIFPQAQNAAQNNLLANHNLGSNLINNQFPFIQQQQAQQIQQIQPQNLNQNFQILMQNQQPQYFGSPIQNRIYQQNFQQQTPIILNTAQIHENQILNQIKLQSQNNLPNLFSHSPNQNKYSNEQNLFMYQNTPIKNNQSKFNENQEIQSHEDLRSYSSQQKDIQSFLIQQQQIQLQNELLNSTQKMQQLQLIQQLNKVYSCSEQNQQQEIKYQKSEDQQQDQEEELKIDKQISQFQEEKQISQQQEEKDQQLDKQTIKEEDDSYEIQQKQEYASQEQDKSEQIKLNNQKEKQNQKNKENDKEKEKIKQKEKAIETKKCFNKFCKNTQKNPKIKQIQSQVVEDLVFQLCEKCYNYYMNNQFCEFCEQVFCEGDSDVDDKDWIQCDKCEKWNHVECELEYNGNEKIEEECKNEDYKYNCPGCLEKQKQDEKQVKQVQQKQQKKQYEKQSNVGQANNKIILNPNKIFQTENENDQGLTDQDYQNQENPENKEKNEKNSAEKILSQEEMCLQQLKIIYGQGKKKLYKKLLIKFNKSSENTVLEQLYINNKNFKDKKPYLSSEIIKQDIQNLKRNFKLSQTNSLDKISENSSSTITISANNLNTKINQLNNNHKENALNQNDFSSFQNLKSINILDVDDIINNELNSPINEECGEKNSDQQKTIQKQKEIIQAATSREGLRKRVKI